MGHTAETKCRDCCKDFTFDQGGGFFFQLLRCDQCGKTKSIGHDKLGDLRKQYHRGKLHSFLIPIEDQERYKQKYGVLPISEKEYHQAVEAIAGPCECSGKYTFDAPPRCRDCRSTRIDEGKTILFYD